VDAGGNLVGGTGVLSVARLGTGQYEVTFGQLVDNCAYVATTSGPSSQALQVFTAGGHSSAQGVYVETRSQDSGSSDGPSGGLTDGSFNLYVSCGGNGKMFAVVDYGANLVRSTPNTTLTPLGSGRYNVTFASSVAACAFIATAGDPSNGQVAAPSGVSAGSGPTPRTVYVETWNPAGGRQADVAFHLAVVCPTAPNSRVAVVNADGLPRRGSSLTGSFSALTGQYTVAVATSAVGCAAFATRDAANGSLPFATATLEAVPGPAFNTTGIHVRELLSFGGAFHNEAFHLALIC
jgi:hypothetical protein